MLSPKDVRELVEEKSQYLKHNEILLDILENNISKYIEYDLEKQLHAQSFIQAMHRIAPLNILPKVIDKLTNIYQTPIVRELPDASDEDQATFDYYKDEMAVNFNMNIANEMFNLAQATLIYPTVSQGTPRLNVIENDRFIVHGADPLNPTQPTHVIMPAGKRDDIDIYWVWSAEEFYVTDANEKIRYDVMAEFNNPEGVNEIGRLPFVYVNKSKRKIMPKQDKDMLKMIKLIPIMYTDLNVAAMFQSFSIIYTIDAETENLPYAPNAVWNFQSDKTSENKPEIGHLKPNVDYDQVLSLIETQLSIWLGTRGIRASTVGALTKDNFASGISKIIDEMDTFEARQKQTRIFGPAEHELWDLILNSMHPFWRATGQIDFTGEWSGRTEVKTSFAVQLPQQTRGQIVNDLKTEVEAGFTTDKIAVAKLNPELTQKQVDDLMAEIKESRSTREDNGAAES